MRLVYQGQPSDEWAFWYEHAYLRQLHPDASDAEIARLVDLYRQELARRLANRAERQAQ